MVHLNRIYTRTGDTGETTLGDGSRVAKTDRRVRAMGSVDEVNTILGLALSADSTPFNDSLRHIQNDLFDLGADLCVPEAPNSSQPMLRITKRQVDRLEEWIDAANESLEPLDSFILPGGSPVAARLHHARAVCRRAEVDVLLLAQNEPINEHISIYLNRLSDLLFVLSRRCNNDGQDDILWIPGKDRS